MNWLRSRPHALVIGVDVSAVALAYAAERQGGERLLQGDAAGLPLAAQSIGLVTALDSFDQMSLDLDQALAEVRRVLRPGGRTACAHERAPLAVGTA